MVKFISDMTEAEFLGFVRRIYQSEYATEKDQVAAVMEFERLSEHPAGSDLLYYPGPGKSGPEAVVSEIKNWRAANGKPGFKA
ncbi:bacteriocin immunity protein [Pseudomonas frederiksbergensis]|uniref:bacteriocin immunity protein n=1 Tax=Pseudomonas frederiksbergensis TaxID=104087 RepID=UPI0019804B4C|nr:bacteriocin immunity protein [Pseudomonas frederiksbergensis]MBN3863954.1 bacteriocin immunity protein [Pseudomonas frederiksbergensis]